MSDRHERSAAAPNAAIEAAGYWRVRHDRGRMSAQEMAEFDQWLAASQAHEDAWTTTADLWSVFDEGEDIHLDAMRAAARAAGRPPRHWLRPMAAALVIGAVSAGIFGLAVFGSLTSQDAGKARSASRYETQRGERATATLEDGSLINLDSDTALEVTFELGRRQVHLSRGQALFEVAKDRHRPFVVQAGTSAVTALGTVFDVKIAPQNLRVVLVEGRVAVKAAGGGHSNAVILAPGQELIADGDGDVRVRSTDTEGALLWRKGLVEFNDTTLADAIEQLNRTSARPLRLADARLGGMRLSGIYHTGSPERFVTSIAQVLPVTGRSASDGVIIEHRKKLPN